MSESEQQQRLIAGLHDPRAWPHPVRDVQVLDTHISHVVLTGDFAYKIKKPVDLGFVDFSTLEKRRHYCEEELRLNRRLCPELYLGIVGIGGTHDAPLVGSQDPIEFAVRMRQFSQDQLLSHLVDAGSLSVVHVDQLADRLSRFHSGLSADRHGPHGRPEEIRKFAMANFAPMRAVIEPESIQTLRDWTAAEFDKRRTLFVSRRSLGFVRECHGDMHLGNMIWADHEVRIFDCIEFNAQLRWIDVMSETAFVVMDLEDRGRPDLAWRLLNRYLESTGDYEGVALLPFYLGYRAMVRAKVAAVRLQQDDVGEEEKESLHRECREYFEQARSYSQSGRQELVITHGLSGSGKTTGSQMLLERRRAIRIRSDVERKRLLGVDPLGSTIGEQAGQAYSTKTTLQTYGRLLRLARITLTAGFPCIVDAAFLKRHDRDIFRQLAAQLNVPFRIAAFEAESSVLEERIRKRAASGSDASEADTDVLSRQQRSFEPLEDDEQTFVRRGG